MGDFLAFRRMVTPILIQIIFWFGVIASVISGLVIMVAGVSAIGGGGGGGSGAGGGVVGFVLGLAVMIGGTLAIRIWCELLILFFRMNETLTDIKNAIERPKPMAGMPPSGAPYGFQPPHQG